MVHLDPRTGYVTNPYARISGVVVWAAVGFFFFMLAGIVGSVVVNSFGKRWFDTWIPLEYWTQWYTQAWGQFDLSHILISTLQVAAACVVLSLLIGIPAAYVLARSNFPGKGVVYVIFLSPIMMPAITYGIPLASTLYRWGVGGTLAGVIMANLVPCVPFVILTMTPFIEQVDPRLEDAARMCGASTISIFRHILSPLLIPGILASAILVLVRTVGMFELTYLVAGPTSQTIVVALYNSMNAAGIRPQQLTDSMAVMYTGMMAVLLVVALRFVEPTQLAGGTAATGTDE